MTKKIYRTAQGKMVDLGSLQLQNENVRAVGNMKVNARGDILDSMNRPISTRNEQVSRQYRRQTTNVVNQSTTKNTKQSIPKPPEDFEDDFDKSTLSETAQKSNETTGLAAAIARARQLKQVPITPSDDSAGIKKI